MRRHPVTVALALLGRVPKLFGRVRLPRLMRAGLLLLKHM